MRTNYVGPALLLGALAERFAVRGSGVLVGVNSVAGERGRAANYVYGSAKAGLTAFLSGPRNRLAASGVHVMRIKPAFVRSRMTDGLDLPALLTADPEEVADALAAALRRGRDVVYVRRIWRPVMALVCAIPEASSSGCACDEGSPGLPLAILPAGSRSRVRQGCRRDRTTARRAGRDEPPCAGGFVEVGA